MTCCVTVVAAEVAQWHSPCKEEKQLIKTKIRGPLSSVRIVQGPEKCVVKAWQEDIEAVCRKMPGTEVRAQGCAGTRAAHLGLLLVPTAAAALLGSEGNLAGTRH